MKTMLFELSERLPFKIGYTAAGEYTRPVIWITFWWFGKYYFLAVII